MAPPAPPPARPKLPPIARAALLLDMDGTLLDIAPTPEAVVVPPDLIASLRALRARLDLTRLPVHSRDVTERVIHATADFDYFTDLVCDEDALADGVRQAQKFFGAA